MATTYDRRRPRIPEELGARIDAARGQRAFDAFVREAVEAALAGGPSPRPNGGEVPEPPRPTRSAPPRASVEYVGCERHPDAGAYRGPNGNWWCADRSCTKAARRAA